MAGLKLERILAPAGGLNSYDPPHAIAKDQAPVLTNWMPGRAGSVNGREPISGWRAIGEALVAASMGTTGEIQSSGSAIPFNGGFLISTNSKTIVLSNVGISGGSCSKTFTHTRGGASLQDKFFGADTASTPRDLVSVTTAASATVLTNAPKNARYVFAYLDALWVFGGRDTPAASTTDEPATLFYSNPGDTVDATAAPWQTTVGAVTTTNKIQVGSSTGLAVAAIPFKRSVLMLKTDSVYQLTGDSPDNFSVRLISDEIVLTQGAARAASDNFVYFVAQGEVKRWDGSSIQPMPSNVFGTLEAVTDISYLGNGRVLFYSSSEASSWLYDELSGTITKISVRMNPIRTDNDITEAAGSMVTYALTNAVPLDNGYVFGLLTTGSGAMMPAYWTGPFAYRPSNSNPDSGFMDVLSASTYGTATSRTVYHFKSRTVRSASPIKKLRLAKLYLDYKCQVKTVVNGTYTGTTDTTTTEFLYVKITSEDGTVLLAETALPSQGSTTSLLRKRHEVDLQGVEASEFYVEVYSKAGSDLKTAADYSGANMSFALPDTIELNDIWVEYQEAQRRVAV